MHFTIRQETKNDYKHTEAVIEVAFEHAEQTDHQEHNLVARVRKSNAFIPELSLIAEDTLTDEIIGHILLSKIKILQNEGTNVDSLALAPISVLPNYQQQGVGKRLINKAILHAKKLGYTSIIVLGHPTYYPKFGFLKASNWNIQVPFEVPDEALMALELKKDALKNISGTIEYSSAFFE